VAGNLYSLLAGNGTDTLDGGKQMNRKPVLAILIGYCLLALAFSIVGVTVTPSSVFADGNGTEPPTQPPTDSTLEASIPTNVEPGLTDTKREEAKDFSFFDAVELMVQVIF